jgi:hypothetical protein
MKRNIVAVVASLSLVAAAPAGAAVSPTCRAYHPRCSSIVSSSSSPNTSATPTTTTTTGTGSLPFTGLDVGLLVAGGGSLAGLGYAIRRTSKRII